MTLIAGGIVVVPTAASAQAGATDQYSGSGTGGGSGGEDLLGAGSAESDSGDLPFTGYPVTPLVALVLLLLAGGLVIRLANSKRSPGDLTTGAPRAP